MPYYITAKNGNKLLSIPIEDKHQYYDTYYQPGYLLKLDQTTGAGLQPRQDNIIHVFDTNRIKIAQGTDEDQRIGNKVMLKTIQTNINFRFLPLTLITDFGHGDLINLYMKFRLMTVHFDDSMTRADIAEWFRATYMPTAYGDGDITMVMSNQVQNLRESTPYTGKFKIIHDTVFSLSKDKCNLNTSLLLKPNKQITFNDTNDITNEDFQNTYTFIITPSFNEMDMDPVSSDRLDHYATSVCNLFSLTANTKITYLDV